jgi:hypothetical protein
MKRIAPSAPSVFCFRSWWHSWIFFRLFPCSYSTPLRGLLSFSPTPLFVDSFASAHCILTSFPGIFFCSKTLPFCLLTGIFSSSSHSQVLNPWATSAPLSIFYVTLIALLSTCFISREKATVSNFFDSPQITIYY